MKLTRKDIEVLNKSYYRRLRKIKKLLKKILNQLFQKNTNICKWCGKVKK